LTPAEVNRLVGGDLAYTTVMTALTRLHEKGAGRAAESPGRAFAYTPPARRAGHRRRENAEACSSRVMIATPSSPDSSARSPRRREELLAGLLDQTRTRDSG